ncbi:protein ENHANCED DISEASE RESISTANCE 2 isoform X1 [Cryptomeria japonica]|uniref:protein ENHANCED DISEASE RESISTANCE 2 isoform X1 n=2 Tax=Cryptomeria japonica TaxID=3369 RepID=UPI0025AD66EA|nr:protein ENHANCED DISEASE RESISTANCE 2 isoform X1 [Cryptomeria japonica]XP_057856727.1 protein ENHANCED DISEASE RESISTANCE 2 isoform X1 [Cryptomeria japonica]XP_059070047.1 protein ENHANCED DISEASE RESISTANCE 2 isoform X1 [Cryptomeria japonica]
MEGWLYVIQPNRLRLQFPRKKYFILQGNALLCFKSMPSTGHEEPVKTGVIDPCIRVADNGRESIHRKVLFVFTLYNSVNHDDELKVGARSSEEAARWMHILKEAALQAQPSQAVSTLVAPRKKMSGLRPGSRRLSSFCRISCDSPDWWLPTMQTTADVIAPSPWKFFGCENGLRLFKEASDGEFRSKHWDNHPAVMAVGVVDATCESVFKTVMSLEPSRSEWDFCYLQGQVIDHLDGHVDIVHKLLQSSWQPWGLTPRDLVLHRYWRREDDGSYVILYHSVTHPKCPPSRGFVRARLKSGGYVISPLTHPQQHPRAVVKHMLAIDWKYWASYLRPSYTRRITLRMLGRIAAMREMFKAKPVHYLSPGLLSRELAMGNASTNNENTEEKRALFPAPECSSHVSSREFIGSLYQTKETTSSFLQFSDAVDEFFDAHSNCESAQTDLDQSLEHPRESEGSLDDEQAIELQLGDHQKTSAATVIVKCFHDLASAASHKRSQVDVHLGDDVDFLSYEATLPKNSACTLPSSWSMADPTTFLIRGKSYLKDRKKIKAKDTLMRMVAADWLRSNKREDNLAGRPGSFIQRRAAEYSNEFYIIINIQVPGATTHNLALYYMMDCPLESVPLLKMFVEGDDAYRNSRFKLIPYIAKGSWIVKQSVGKNACLLGQALEINYTRGSNYLELGIDIGSSCVAKGVVNLVLGYLSKLVIELAILIQGNTEDELPEFLLGTCRLNHLEESKSVPAGQKYPQAT